MQNPQGLLAAKIEFPAMRTICIRLLLCLTLVAGCESANTQTTLTFIHLNDTYRIDSVEEGRRGGFGRVATIVRQLKAAGHDVRILHGGDFLYPSLESQLWAGEQMVDALNFLDSLAPLYVVPGNHEFDPRTADSLARALRESEFDWIGRNLHFATGDELADRRLQPELRFDSGSKTVGIFGLTLAADDGGNVRDYAPVDGDYVRHAEESLRQLDAAGADLIIGLTHLHLADDLELAKLRQRYPAFKFIIGGHEHEPEFKQGENIATVMKGASNARTIWRIDVDFNPARGEPAITTQRIEVDESIAPDPEYQQLADRWRARLLDKMPFLPSKVGVAALPLDGREVAIRNAESNWGNFIVDQMRGAFGDPPADFAFVNSGTLRIDDFVAEGVTFEDLGRTFGFSSFLRYMTMSGADFRRLLEAGFRGSGPSKGYFPQISGFRVCVDRSRPEGQRIVQLLVPVNDEWQEITADRDYRLVAPDFLYRGGDGYDFSAASEVSRPGSELKYLVLDAILVAQAKGEKIGAPVDPELRRIAFAELGAGSCF